MKLFGKIICLILSLLLISAGTVTAAFAYVADGIPSVSTTESFTALAIGGENVNPQSDSIYKISGQGWTVERGNDTGIQRGTITLALPSSVVLEEQPYFQTEVYIDMDAVPYSDSDAKDAYFDVAVLSSDKGVLASLKLGADNGGRFGIPTDAARVWIPLQLDLSAYGSTAAYIRIYYFNNTLLTWASVNTSTNGTVYLRNVKTTSDATKTYSPYTFGLQNLTAQTGETIAKTTYEGRACWQYDFQNGGYLILKELNVDPQKYNYVVVNYFCSTAAVTDGSCKIDFQSAWDLVQNKQWGDTVYVKSTTPVEGGSWHSSLLNLPNKNAFSRIWLSVGYSYTNNKAGTIYISSITFGVKNDAPNDEADTVLFPESIPQTVYFCPAQNGTYSVVDRYGTGSVTETNYQGKRCYRYNFVSDSNFMITDLNLNLEPFNKVIIQYYSESFTGRIYFQTKDNILTESEWGGHFDNTARTEALTTGSWQTAVINFNGSCDKFKSILLSMGQAGSNSGNGTIYIASVVLTNEEDVLLPELSTAETAISLVGMQRSIFTYTAKEGTPAAYTAQSLRFIAVLHVPGTELRFFTHIGIRVYATIGTTTYLLEKAGTNVYNRIYATMESGEVKTIEASTYGGTYLAAFCVKDVPVADEIVLEVVPYLVDQFGCEWSGKIGNAIVETGGALMDESAYLMALDTRVSSIRSSILTSEPNLSGRSSSLTYYVSNSGNDSNNGKSPATAWATLSKAGSVTTEGATILFECGGVWRGSLYTQSGVMYSHYGNVEDGLPIICQSNRNYADAALWESVSGYPNLWKCTRSLTNVGIIAFDHDGTLNNYDAVVGVSQVVAGRTTSLSSLTEDLHFYSDPDTNKLYLYSANGNPGSRFSSIEIGEARTAISVTNGVIIDGLRVQYSGSFGISGTNVENVTVKNCIVEWCGGSTLADGTVYGNGIQLYENTSGCTLDHNWCYECFDTGITIQSAVKGSKVNMNHNSISNNLIEYCHYGVELYNHSATGDCEDLTISSNIIRYSGMGWGDVERARMLNSAYLANRASGIVCFGINSTSNSILVEDNVIMCSKHGQLILYVDESGSSFGLNEITFDGNDLIQMPGEPLLKYGSTSYGIIPACTKYCRSALGDSALKFLKASIA